MDAHQRGGRRPECGTCGDLGIIERKDGPAVCVCADTEQKRRTMVFHLLNAARFGKRRKRLSSPVLRADDARDVLAKMDRFARFFGFGSFDEMLAFPASDTKSMEAVAVMSWEWERNRMAEIIAAAPGVDGKAERAA